MLEGVDMVLAIKETCFFVIGKAQRGACCCDQEDGGVRVAAVLSLFFPAVIQ